MQRVSRRFCDLTVIMDWLSDSSKPGRTASVPELGGLRLPLVIASQICSLGTSSSSHMTVNSGASHRTIDDGSSKRMIRFSSLQLVQHVVAQIEIQRAFCPHICVRPAWPSSIPCTCREVRRHTSGLRSDEKYTRGTKRTVHVRSFISRAAQ